MTTLVPDQAAATASTGRPTVAVVVCAYTEERWEDLVAGWAALSAQSRVPDEVVLVVDHNEALLERVRRELPGLRAVENAGERGLSGARNSGIAACRSDVVLFLDDDACPDVDWVARSTDGFEDAGLVGIGGWAEPAWDAPGRPSWFPESFLWVVGCSYEGLPTHGAPIRNPIGATMGFRRADLLAAGGFTSGIGRVGKHPVGCEETELSIRLRQAGPDTAHIELRRDAVVRHRVRSDRGSVGYFTRRCFWEGYSKAVVAAAVGAQDALSSERGYASRTLPVAVARGLGRFARSGDTDGAAQAGAVVLGFGATALGYAYGLRTRPVPATPTQGAPALPVWCTEVDLATDPAVDTGGALTALAELPADATSMRVLVRHHGEPVGYVQLPADSTLTAEDLLRRLPAPARDRLRDASGEPPADALTSVPTAQRVTVVVCTRDRADELQDCLRGLGALTYPNLEVLVVDNAPTSSATREVVEEFASRDARFRYTVEPRPGLSNARNAGLAAATGEIVAYTDDDVRVDELWVHGLVRGFARRPDVACVTGLAATASLDSEVEAYFDSRVSWATLRPAHVYDLDENRDPGALYPFSPGLFGTGANVAFRREVLVSLGGFDAALGAGAPTRGGEDLDAFVQVLLRGHALAFEPAAVVWHHHRADLPGLLRQMYGYGSGLTAFYAKLLADPLARGPLLRGVPHGMVKLVRNLRSASGAGSGVKAPAGVLRREVAGMVMGPYLYWKARRDL